LQPILEQFERDTNVPAIEIAAALAGIVQGKTPLRLAERAPSSMPPNTPSELGVTNASDTAPHRADEAKPSRKKKQEPRLREDELETYRIDVGRVHGVKPANIIGAIANEAGLDGRHIGRLDIRQDHSFIDLPKGMPKEIARHLQKVRVAGQLLNLGRAPRTVAEELRESRTRPRRVRKEQRTGKH
jgi:ATP-dependent RNA helicase DeaD